MADKQHRFISDRTYTIGRLSANQEASAPNPSMMVRPKAVALKGSQLINNYNTRTSEEFWANNPIGLPDGLTFHILETSDGGDKVYFDSGTVLPAVEEQTAPATEVPADVDTARATAQQSEGLADNGSPGLPAPHLYTNVPPQRPPTQSSVYQPAMDALMEQIREERKLTMALIEENKMMREQMLAESREYRTQVGTLVQQNSTGLSDARDAAEVAGIHASQAKVLEMRMDMLVEQNKREAEWNAERAAMKEDALRKELATPPSTTLGDITGTLEALVPLAPFLTEIAKGLFGGNQQQPPPAAPGYPAPLPPAPPVEAAPPPPPPPPQAVAPTPRAVAPMRIPSGRNGAIPGSGNSSADMAELETF